MEDNEEDEQDPRYIPFWWCKPGVGDTPNFDATCEDLAGSWELQCRYEEAKLSRDKRKIEEVMKEITGWEFDRTMERLERDEEELPNKPLSSAKRKTVRRGPRVETLT